jgi:hypothetical protein
VTLDVYSHVLIDEPEWVIAEMRALLYPATDETPAGKGITEEVEDTGIEPVTFALPARRSPS